MNLPITVSVTVIYTTNTDGKFNLQENNNDNFLLLKSCQVANEHFTVLNQICQIIMFKLQNIIMSRVEFL